MTQIAYKFKVKNNNSSSSSDQPALARAANEWKAQRVRGFFCFSCSATLPSPKKATKEKNPNNQPRVASTRLVARHELQLQSQGLRKASQWSGWLTPREISQRTQRIFFIVWLILLFDIRTLPREPRNKKKKAFRLLSFSPHSILFLHKMYRWRVYLAERAKKKVSKKTKQKSWISLIYYANSCMLPIREICAFLLIPTYDEWSEDREKPFLLEAGRRRSWEQNLRHSTRTFYCSEKNSRPFVFGARHEKLFSIVMTNEQQTQQLIRRIQKLFSHISQKRPWTIVRINIHREGRAHSSRVN